MKNHYIYESLIGNLLIEENGHSITKVSFNPQCAQGRKTDLTDNAFHQLQEYFSGTRTKFDLPLEPEGTLFQKGVWAKLQDIPYGKTASYKDIAQAINNPNAFRAVGNANNKNPIPIIIPCHRCVGSNGKLTGYAGGLELKQRLLDLEQGLSQPI